MSMYATPLPRAGTQLTATPKIEDIRNGHYDGNLEALRQTVLNAHMTMRCSADAEGRTTEADLLASEARVQEGAVKALEAIKGREAVVEANWRADREDQERRISESAAVRMANPAIFGSAGTEKHSTVGVGAQLREAVADVMSGRLSQSFVDLDIRAGLTEAGPAGGAVPIDLRDAVHTLRAKSVMLGLPGVQTVTMTSDRTRFPRLGAATASGVAEAAEFSEDTPDVDLVDLVAQKFAVYTLLSTELEEDLTQDALSLFGQNMLEALARKVDRGFLEGAGASDVIGLRNITGVNSTSVAALPADFDKFSDALYEAQLDNAEPNVWIAHPRSWNTLSKIKTGISSDKTTLLEPSPQDAPRTLLGLPVHLSTQITLTEGAGAGSWVAALDTSQVVIGIRRPARLEVSRDVKFSSDQVAIRATTRVAFAALNPEGISLLTDVRIS